MNVFQFQLAQLIEAHLGEPVEVMRTHRHPTVWQWVYATTKEHGEFLIDWNDRAPFIRENDHAPRNPE